jgi:hypothetical protein
MPELPLEIDSVLAVRPRAAPEFNRIVDVLLKLNEDPNNETALPPEADNKELLSKRMLLALVKRKALDALS